jgi:MFS family permease
MASKLLKKYKLLGMFSLMLFALMVFDGLMGYIAPLAITQSGLSKTMVGVIVSLSSVGAAAFDFLLSKILPSTHFRRILLVMFLLATLYILVLFQVTTVIWFIVAVCLRGLYYVLLTFSSFNFITRVVPKSENVSSIGFTEAFRSLGYLISPILGGLLVAGSVSVEAYGGAVLFLSLGLFFYGIVIFQTRKLPPQGLYEAS